MSDDPRKGCIQVLIADDEAPVCQLLKEYIGLLGGKADIARDGKRALEYLDSKRYDFVFLDFNMPELTGLEVAKYLKSKKPRPKIIMMTGYGPIDEDFAKASGIDIYLPKPIALDDIKKIVSGEYKNGG
ncbi:MAG: response regulator [Candidatus Omnitrophica bacterium]|nr:response regulator [Candidatus Omnitrophota bacterium]